MRKQLETDRILEETGRINVWVNLEVLQYSLQREQRPRRRTKKPDENPLTTLHKYKCTTTLYSKLNISLVLRHRDVSELWRLCYSGVSKDSRVSRAVA